MLRRATEDHDRAMPLVLLPGFMTDPDLWADMAPSLAPFGPILHGDLGRDDTIAAMARRVAEEAPERFALIGFSMGGYVAREIARLAPERIEALVLLSRSAILGSVHPDRVGDQGLVARIRSMGDRLGGDVFLRQAGQARASDRDRLATITCPTLVVAAAQDALRSLDEARELRDGIPGAALIVIDGSGHMLPMEAPEALAEAIVPWLRDQLSGASTIGS